MPRPFHRWVGKIEPMTPEQQQASWRTTADQLLIENERLRGIVR